jgi:hypothetical protein
MVCKECDHRYTSFSEDVSLNRVGKRSLNESQVLLILSSTKRHIDLAVEYGVSSNVIACIRKGTRYIDIYKKFHGLTNDDLNGCTKCHFWEDRCTFGFPEAGGTFASDCTLFQSKQ